MQTLFWSAAVTALSGSMVLPPPALADTPQVASTQVVNFSLDSSFCPQHGLYGIAHVSVNGTAGMTADQNFIWTTQTAATSIHSVPRQGAVANVTVVYHCNVQVLWWLEPGAAHKVTAALWVKGSPPQPSYTIKPHRPASPPTPSQTPQPTPSQAARLTTPPTPSQAAQLTTPQAPTQTAQPTIPPTPSEAAQLTTPQAPTQAPQTRRRPRRQPS